MSPIRVCIGTEPRTEIARKVLEFSIRKHVAPGAALEICELTDSDWRRDRSAFGPLGQRTGFSLCRWTIPERFGYAGKAVYLDSDQLCLADIGELWNADRAEPPTGDAATVAAAAATCVWCTRFVARPRRRFLPLLRQRLVLPETSVMLIDCAKARGRLWTPEHIARWLAARPTATRYDAVMHLTYLEQPPGELDRWWNVMDRWGRGLEDLEDPRAKLLHFTRVPTQPWFDPEHPARALWERYLRDAIDAGAVGRDDIARACAAGDRDVPAGADRPRRMHPYWQRYAR